MKKNFIILIMVLILCIMTEAAVSQGITGTGSRARSLIKQAKQTQTTQVQDDRNVNTGPTRTPNNRKTGTASNQAQNNGNANTEPAPVLSEYSGNKIQKMLEKTTDQDETITLFYQFLNEKKPDLIYDNLLSADMKKTVKRSDFRTLYSSAQYFEPDTVCNDENSDGKINTLTVKGKVSALTVKGNRIKKEEPVDFEQKIEIKKDGKYWKIQSISEL